MKKNTILVTAMITAFIMVFSYIGGFTLMNVMAGDSAKKAVPYYTSVQLESGDSLWSLAAKYNHNSGLSTDEYIQKLRNINQLKSDLIHAGQYVTVVYYKSE